VTLVVPLVRELSAPFPDAEVLSFSVTPSGDALTLWTSAAGRALLTGRDPSGMFAESAPPRAVDVVVALDTPHVRRRTWDLSITTSFPTAHAMPADGVLVVGARAVWRGQAPEHNAYIYDRDGEVIRSACLGDGIAHVVTTAKGAVFVAYFDEGVLGSSRGWGGRGREPIGAPGLNRFGPHLERAWSNDTADILDAYALAGAGEGCVLFAYPGRQVVTYSEDGAPASFSAPTGGATAAASATAIASATASASANALAIQGDLIALAGGYNPDQDRVVLARLTPGTPGVLPPALHPIGAGRLTLPDGTWSPAHVVGRDSTLHAFAGHAWHAIQLRDLATSLKP
jgi:hypothetical protein